MKGLLPGNSGIKCARLLRMKCPAIYSTPLSENAEVGRQVQINNKSEQRSLLFVTIFSRVLLNPNHTLYLWDS
jgi:hypothetical protein